MGKLRRAFSRLFLQDVDPSYAVVDGEEPLYIDVRLSFNNAEQRRLNELSAIQRPSLEVQFEVTTRNAAREAAIKAAEEQGEPRPDVGHYELIPPMPEEYYRADNEWYALYSAGTNVTEIEDTDGKSIPLEPATNPQFWQHMTQEVKNAVAARFRRESAAREKRQSGEDFTTPPAGSS